VQARTADEILGLSFATSNLNRGLDLEIDAYILDSQTGTSSLAFWQVRLVLCNLMTAYDVSQIGKSASLPHIV